MSSSDVVIVGAARTPIGRLLGGLSSLKATELGSWAIRGALGGIDPGVVDAVIMGQVLQAGAGQNPTKQAAHGAGISPRAHTVTVNKVCLSGLSAVIDAARLLRSGEAGVVVAGGMESMSNAPTCNWDPGVGPDTAPSPWPITWRSMASPTRIPVSPWVS